MADFHFLYLPLAMSSSQKTCLAEPLAEALGGNFTVSVTHTKFAIKQILLRLIISYIPNFRS